MILHFGLCITYRVLFHPSKSAGIHSHGAFRLVSKPTKWLSFPHHSTSTLRIPAAPSALRRFFARRVAAAASGFVTGCRRRFCTRSWRRCSTALRMRFSACAVVGSTSELWDRHWIDMGQDHHFFMVDSC